MNKETARTLIEQYVESWVTRDLPLFLETLHDEVIVRECYGPVYEDKETCEEWFRSWHDEGNRVLDWTIDSFVCNPDATTAAFEWDFQCLAEGEEHAFFGSSHVTFRDGRIYSINEYERTKEQYRP